VLVLYQLLQYPSLAAWAAAVRLPSAQPSVQPPPWAAASEAAHANAPFAHGAQAYAAWPLPGRAAAVNPAYDSTFGGGMDGSGFVSPAYDSAIGGGMDGSGCVSPAYDSAIGGGMDGSGCVNPAYDSAIGGGIDGSGLVSPAYDSAFGGGMDGSGFVSPAYDSAIGGGMDGSGFVNPAYDSAFGGGMDGSGFAGEFVGGPERVATAADAALKDFALPEADAGAAAET
jgi:hypothetical protein